jgi:hypothetical protein
LAGLRLRLSRRCLAEDGRACQPVPHNKTCGNGTPLDINLVSSIAQVLLTAAGAFLAAHGSYSLITGKTQG